MVVLVASFGHWPTGPAGRDFRSPEDGGPKMCWRCRGGAVEEKMVLPKCGVVSVPILWWVHF